MPVLQRRPRQAVDEDEEPSQRPRQRARRDASESGAESDGSDENGVQRDNSNEQQLVKKLVRYAIACEYSRTAIRRDGIRERVLGSHGRSFKRVFSGAQKQLRAVFGMEMVELPVRDKDTMSLGEKRKAAKSNTQGKTSSSNAYILVTRLPEHYRTSTIIPPSKVQSPDNEASYIGVYTFIITVITLNGGSLSDNKLRRYLQRMNAGDNMPTDKTDNVLLKLIRQGYIVKTVEKRPEKDDDTILWSVGPRGKLEVGADAIASFVRAVYGESTEALEKKIQVSLRINNGDRAENGTAEEGHGSNGAAAGSSAGASAAEGSRRRSRRHAEDDDD